MSVPPSSSRPDPLSVDRIVDAAVRIVERDGLGRLSMRRLGAELGVDPMAVYHHVAGKRELLALVAARTIGRMRLPDPSAPWDVRVTQWATAYWEVVVANRELTLAGLADPEVSAGGLPATEPLLRAVADSGLSPELVEPSAFIVVDAVHGAALASGSPGRHDAQEQRTMFEAGIATIVAGIAARAGASRSERPRDGRSRTSGSSSRSR